MSNSIPKAIAFSPITKTTLSVAINSDKVYVENIDAFADLAIGEIGIITFCSKVNLVSFDPADFETGTYTGKGSDGDGDFLSGVTKGIEGTARSWDPNTYVSSYSSAHAWNIMRSVIAGIIVDKVEKSGDTMEGKLFAQSNVDYSTSQVRNVTLSTENPTGGNNGDLWFKYES